MRYPKVLIDNSSYQNDGLLYFIHRLYEMLFDYSNSLHKVPLHNTNGLICEYCDTYTQVNEGIQKSYQLEKIQEELLYSFNKDIILSECWGKKNIDYINKKLGSLSSPDKYKVYDYLKSKFSNGLYYQWSVTVVKKFVKLPREKKKIEESIRCWISELIGLGYSSQYIFTELKETFFCNSIITMQDFDEFMSKFNFQDHEYSVYFAVDRSVLQFSDILKTRINANFTEDDNFKKFKIRKQAICYFKNVEAHSPNQAAKIAFDRLNLFLKFYKFVGNKKFFSMNKIAMVIQSNEDKAVFVNYDEDKFHIADEIDIGKVSKDSEKLITGLLINSNNNTVSRLMRAIDLHNTAIGTNNLSGGFVNLWASLEVILGGVKPESKIKSVSSILVPILEKDFLLEHIVDIDTKLKTCLEENKYKELIKNIECKGCTNKKLFSLFLLEQFKVQRKELIDILIDYPVIRSRISELGASSKMKNLSTKVSSYKQRVEWHLYRMYRVRNGIVHSGIEPIYIKYLGEHLHSYVDALLNEFIAKLSGDIAYTSTDHIITDVLCLKDNFSETLEMDTDITDEIIKIFMHPELGHIFNCENYKHEGVE